MYMIGFPELYKVYTFQTQSRLTTNLVQLKYGGGHPAPLDRSWALRRPIQSAFRGLFTPLNIHPNTKSAFVKSAVGKD